MSTFTHILTIAATPALLLAAARGTLQVSRALLLYKAGSTALKKGTEDPQGKAGLEIVAELTRKSEPWFRAILGRRPDDSQQ